MSHISTSASMEQTKRNSGGILRMDSNPQMRRPSLDSKLFAQKEPTSPQPSIDRLSVTFAEDSVRRSEKFTYSQKVVKMDKVHFPGGTESDEEDYSASVNAIIQRRASSKLSRRRSSRRSSSSPFSPDILPTGNDEGDRRRSSVYTTSSGDTAITMDENLANEVTQEQIFENIKLHKEVLTSVKMQPWNMRKKLKLVIQAKNYIKRHEGALQERLAQSHSTRDMLARWNIYLVKKWQRYRREMANLSNWFLPWERKIKEIESHFGSVVASYFIFLRWLFWVNIVLAIVLISFVAVPEMLTADVKAAGDRKFILPEEKYNSTNFLTLWDFEGVFKYSPLFYGWYTNRDSHIKGGYRLPFAYFVTGLVLYAYSFFATLRKMAENSRMSKLSEKDDECIFSWKLFTAWDYMIGNPETAHNRVASIVMGFKEALLEEAEKKRESRNWKVICFRILVNTIVLGLLSTSAYAVIYVVKRSTEPESMSTVWRRNEITVVLSLISTFFPMFFEGLGFVEQYHPRKQLRLQLARIMVLNLLNLYSLIFALFDKVADMTKELEDFKNLTPYLPSTEIPLATITNLEPITNCYEHCPSDIGFSFTSLMTSLINNISVFVFPLIKKMVENGTSFSNGTDIGEEFTNFTDWTNFTGPTIITAIGNWSELRNLTELVNLTTLSNLTMENSTWGENTTIFSDELIFDDVRDVFIDYLSYVLSGFRNDTDFNPQNFTDFLNLTNTTLEPFLNETHQNMQGNPYVEVTTSLNNCSIICSSTDPPPQLSETSLNYTTRSRLRSLCWETMFGQELIKLTVMDLIMTILSTLALDFVRDIFVRVMNRCWCWDLEKKFPQYAEFKVAENILHLVNNQGMVWMGMFFSPGLVVLNVVKLFIMMYLRAWAVLTCNVPPEVIFRASRSNNFYYALLLMMLFLCVLPVGYAIVWIRPSWHCGPFSNYHRIFHIFTRTIKDNVPELAQRILDYIASPGIVIPLLVLLILIIYYLISLTSALREANNDLKQQLRRERTEERRKMFQIADRRRRGEAPKTPFDKWKKLLSSMPSAGKSFEDTSKPHSNEVKEEPKQDFFSKLIKKALGKHSTSEDDLNQDTDTEQQLPEDVEVKTDKPLKRSTSSSSYERKQPSTSRDSGSWSEIPVIKISKIGSSDNLDEKKERKNRIRALMLRKQKAEEETLTDNSSSDYTKESQETVLNYPNVGKSEEDKDSDTTHTKTESSSAYRDFSSVKTTDVFFAG